MTHLIDPAVTDGAACKDIPKAIFYPDEEGPGGRRWAQRCRRQALAICADCPMKAACLAEEIRLTVEVGAGRSYGIRGGLTASARDALIRAKRKTGEIPKRARQINHGTYGGAAAHRRNGEGACHACAEAARIYSAEKSRRFRAAQVPA